ncbi:hypothetical protein HK24_04440 [Gluconobacter sp. DsW_058]|nr:hypothetical protein HK24_04440 [Gluconobacter sp. DsW_058]
MAYAPNQSRDPDLLEQCPKPATGLRPLLLVSNTKHGGHLSVNYKSRSHKSIPIFSNRHFHENRFDS